MIGTVFTKLSFIEISLVASWITSASPSIPTFETELVVIASTFAVSQSSNITEYSFEFTEVASMPFTYKCSKSTFTDCFITVNV